MSEGLTALAWRRAPRGLVLERTDICAGARVNETVLMVPMVPAVLIFGLSGCGTKAPATTSVPLASPRAAVPPSPASVVVSATPLVPPAVTTGWATYRDPRFAFHVLLPPGWHAGSFTSTTPTGPSYYIVQFFPPQTPVKPGDGATTTAPELIQITVASAPPYGSVANDPSWGAEPSPVMIGTTQATLYYHGDPTGEEVLRMAYLQQGALQFSFSLRVASDKAPVAVDPAKVTRDMALYLGMLQRFHLTTS